MKRKNTASLATAAIAGLTLFDIAAAHAQQRMPLQIDWSGFYAGVGLGYASTRSTVTPVNGNESFSTSPGNFYGNINIGYLQSVIQGSRNRGRTERSSIFDGVVVGVEGSLDYSHADGVVIPSAVEHVRIYTDLGATLRLRGGFDIPGTGIIVTVNPGIAFLQEHTTRSNTNGVQISSDSYMRVGWTIGTTIEGPLASNWSWRLDYSYLNFGNHTYGNNAYEVKTRINRVGLGLAYHFNPPPLPPPP